MLKYLRTLHSQPKRLVVTGNQAADMDSCCSALVAAYLETNVWGHAAVPLIDIPRQELALRRDVEMLFSSLHIDPQWLLFRDDLQTTDETELILVDHNSPTIKGNVVRIIDHHAPEGPLPERLRNYTMLVESGSCMSLIVNLYLCGARAEQARKLFVGDTALVPLAMAPIIQDTSNLTKKVKPIDNEAMDILHEFAPTVFAPTVFSPQKSYKALKAAKSDVSGLSPDMLLRKDYKQWGSVGFSSVPALLSDLDARKLAQAAIAYREENQLLALIMLGSGKIDGKYTREFAFCGPESFNPTRDCPDLRLELFDSVLGVRFYLQHNTEATRKQVAPIIRSALESGSV